MSSNSYSKDSLIHDGIMALETALEIVNQLGTGPRVEALTNIAHAYARLAEAIPAGSVVRKRNRTANW